MDVKRLARDMAGRVNQNAPVVLLSVSLLIIAVVSSGWLFGDAIVRYFYDDASWFDAAAFLDGSDKYGSEHYAARFRALVSAAVIVSTLLISLFLVCGIFLYRYRATETGWQKLTSYYLSEKSQVIVLAGYSFILLAVFYLIVVRPESTYLSIWANDLFIFFDGAYRLSQGQTPHLDFHTPVGALAYALPLVGLKWQGGFAGSMESASLIVTAFILLSASRLLASRYSLPVSILSLLILSLVLMVPVNVGDTSENITFAMFYNRYGWAALTVLFLCYCEPRNNAAYYLDALLVALILAFLFYTKITYFAVGLVFLPVLAIASRYNLRLATSSFVLLCVMLLLLEFWFGISVPYIRDIMTSVHASGVIRDNLLGSFVMNIGEYLLVGLVVSVVILARQASVGYVIFVLYVCGSGLAILDQNAQKYHIVTLLAVLIASHEIVSRSDKESFHSSASGQKNSISFVTFIFTVVLIFLATPLSARVGSLIKYVDEINKVDTWESIPALSGFKIGEQVSLLSQVLNDEDAVDLFYALRNTRAKQRLTQGEYIETIIDGYSLLQTMDLNDKSVSVLDYVNPYSFLLGLRPPSGDYSFIDKNRNITADVYMPARKVYKSSHYLMMPKFPINYPTNNLLKDIYGQYIDSEYMHAGESDYWDLYSRKY